MKPRISLSKALAFVFVVFAMLITLVGCQSIRKVTFFVDGKEYKTVEIKKGEELKLPQDPQKEGYRFSGWFLEKTFKTEFNPKKVNAKKVYAKFVAIIIETFVDGKSQGEVELLRRDENLPVKEGLTLDKWYVDENFKTKYTNQDVDKLYARFVAVVEFDNGYEIIKTHLLNPNEKIEMPNIETFVKPYMDKKGIRFVNEDLSEFDFSQNITKNTKIKVLWQTPYLEFKLNPLTNNLKIVNVDSERLKAEIKFENIPCMSFPGVTDWEHKVGGETVIEKNKKVEAINFGHGFSFPFTKKYIINEGIEVISELNQFLGSTLQEVSLPKSLKVLENSFNTFLTLADVKLPENLEVIINCFWKKPYGYFGDHELYDFDIVIPDSVKNIADVPNNFKFGEKSPFKKENGFIYKYEGNDKILIATDRKKVDNLKIPEGVTKIQVGALVTRNFDSQFYKSLTLPKSFKGINFNEPKSNYPSYSKQTTALYVEDFDISSSFSNFDRNGFAICDCLNRIAFVSFAANGYPSTLHEYAFYDLEDYDALPYNDEKFKTKIYYSLEVEKGKNIKVVVDIKDVLTGKDSVIVSDYLKEINLVSGDKFTEEIFFNNFSLKKEDIEFKEINLFGKKINFNDEICVNGYISVQFISTFTGIKYETKADQTIIVTGFDLTTAGIDEHTNTSIVIIPDMIYDKPITEISEDAFSGNERISEVYIGKNVKVIGKHAFYKTRNLKKVSIKLGGLEEILEGAFLESGVEEVTLPLANLKKVEPYAFKSESLSAFRPVKEEEGRMLINFLGAFSPDDKVDFILTDRPDNEFYFIGINYKITAYRVFKSIIKKVSTTVEIVKDKKDAEEATVPVKVVDVQYVATAVKSINDKDYYGGISFGVSYRYRRAHLSVIRYEIMEGSVYYIKKHMSFNLVKRVWPKAFTDIDPEVTKTIVAPNGSKSNKIAVYDSSLDESYNYDSWLLLSDLKNKEIFNDGWWEGITESDPEYKQKLEFLDYVKYESSVNITEF